MYNLRCSELRTWCKTSLSKKSSFSGVILTIIGVAQIGTGVYFMLSLPLFKIGSNIWTGIADCFIGSTCMYYGFTKQGERRSYYTLIYHTFGLVVNSINLIIVQIGEKSSFVSEEISQLLERNETNRFVFDFAINLATALSVLASGCAFLMCLCLCFVHVKSFKLTKPNIFLTEAEKERKNILIASRFFPPSRIIGLKEKIRVPRLNDVNGFISYSTDNKHFNNSSSWVFNTEEPPLGLYSLGVEMYPDVVESGRRLPVRHSSFAMPKYACVNQRPRRSHSFLTYRPNFVEVEPHVSQVAVPVSWKPRKHVRISKWNSLNSLNETANLKPLHRENPTIKIRSLKRYESELSLKENETKISKIRNTENSSEILKSIKPEKYKKEPIYFKINKFKGPAPPPPSIPTNKHQEIKPKNLVSAKSTKETTIETTTKVPDLEKYQTETSSINGKTFSTDHVSVRKELSFENPKELNEITLTALNETVYDTISNKITEENLKGEFLYDNSDSSVISYESHKGVHGNTKVKPHPFDQTIQSEDESCKDYVSSDKINQICMLDLDFKKKLIRENELKNAKINLKPTKFKENTGSKKYHHIQKPPRISLLKQEARKKLADYPYYSNSISKMSSEIIENIREINKKKTEFSDDNSISSDILKNNQNNNFKILINSNNMYEEERNKLDFTTQKVERHNREKNKIVLRVPSFKTTGCQTEVYKPIKRRTSHLGDRNYKIVNENYVNGYATLNIPRKNFSPNYRKLSEIRKSWRESEPPMEQKICRVPHISLPLVSSSSGYSSPETGKHDNTDHSEVPSPSCSNESGDEEKVSRVRTQLESVGILRDVIIGESRPQLQSVRGFEDDETVEDEEYDNVTVIKIDKTIKNKATDWTVSYDEDFHFHNDKRMNDVLYDQKNFGYKNYFNILEPENNLYRSTDQFQESINPVMYSQVKNIPKIVDLVEKPNMAQTFDENSNYLPTLRRITTKYNSKRHKHTYPIHSYSRTGVENDSVEHDNTRQWSQNGVVNDSFDFEHDNFRQWSENVTSNDLSTSQETTRSSPSPNWSIEDQNPAAAYLASLEMLASHYRQQAIMNAKKLEEQKRIFEKQTRYDDSTNEFERKKKYQNLYSDTTIYEE